CPGGKAISIAAAKYDESPSVRIAATYALGELRCRSAVRLLVRIVDAADEPPVLRGMAAEALGKIGDADAVDELIKTLQTDPNPSIRYSCIFSLGELRDARALPLLRRLSRRSEEMSEFGSLRTAAERAVGKIRSASHK